MERNGLLAFTLVFAIVILLNECNSVALDTLSLGASLRGNQTIISANGRFELGFFSPSGGNNWYIGIWSVPRKTVVWVANRETPVRNMAGVFRLSRDGFLALFDQRGASVWSANVSKAASHAVILESANFLLLAANNKSETVWQSFDHPGNTWLPGMKFGRDQKLVSWKNSLDPAPGIFSFQIDPVGNNRFVLLSNNTAQYWRSGPWDNDLISETSPFLLVKFSLENSSSGLYLTYMLRKDYLFGLTDNFLGFALRTDGVFGVEYYREQFQESLDSAPDQCEVYKLCGPYGFCKGWNDRDPCICPEGFKPRDEHAWDLHEWWSSGCVYHAPLNCDSQNGSTDGFIEFSNAWLPDKAAYSCPAQTWEACEELCVRNCSCIAYSCEPCQIWSRDLFNMGNLSDTLALVDYVLVRVGAGGSRLGPASSASSHQKATTIVVSVLVAVGALLIALLFTILAWRRRRLRSTQRCPDSSDAFLRTFSYEDLKTATRNFRYKLGTGGFGSVFKGTLTDGTHVAVKKLASSKHCEKQFRAEINSVGIIHHINLVRLIGFCAQGSRRLLVYDYMPNGSLNSFLFTNYSKSQLKILDWRTRFEIALGTGRGLLYLHEKCRDCIIHSDIKPENILLDENFSPKLGDFGLAKLVGRDFSHVLTTTRGTRGYLAPEWISGLPITSKVDVYSFGMTLLEIISGRRNLDLNVQESSRYYFPAWAEEQICQGNMINIVDKRIANDADVEEVRRAALVSLLCIQNDENARPNMAQVLLMLEGKTETHTPQIPTVVMMNQQVDRGNTDSDSYSESGIQLFEIM